MVSVAEAITSGNRCHQAGQWDEAERQYRQALEVDPRNALAQALLGQLLVEQGRIAEAEPCLRAVVELAPQSAGAHFNLAGVLQAQAKSAEAVESYRSALTLEPNNADAHNNLGTVLQRLRDFSAAELHYRQAIAIRPAFGQAHNNLGSVLSELGQRKNAIAQFERAIELGLQAAEVHCNLADCLQALGQYEKAAQASRRAIALDPTLVDAHTNLGICLFKLGRPEEAIAAHRRALELNPRFAPAYNNLASVLADLGRRDEAVDCYRRAAELSPSDPEIYTNLAGALHSVGAYEEGMAAARRALEIDPSFVTAWCNLGSCLHKLGRQRETIDACRAAVRLDPTNAHVHSNLVCALNLDPTLSPAEVYREHLSWGQTHADPLTAGHLPHAHDRTPTRRLRIGYVSPDFYLHPVAMFAETFFAAHDRSQFEVYFYSDVTNADEVTERLRGYVGVWREVAGQTDEQLSELVRHDAIDILVDLAGHTAKNRLLTFARKPAPVQVSYLGYQNTTGMAALDYRLTDAWADPPVTSDPFYTEELVRLPDAFFCYRPYAQCPPVSSLPALTSGRVTFASFSRFEKLLPEVLATWGEILLKVPGSRLMLQVPAAAEERVRRAYERQGVDPARILCLRSRSYHNYFDLFAETDVALDPFPLNGHTTTCDSLWMGVPVVMLAGQTYPARFGGSALVNLGLEDLIADSPQRYTEIAVGLAGDLDRLARLRSELRPRMQGSPLVDAARFTRNLEAAYRQMWTRWCGSATAR